MVFYYPNDISEPALVTDAGAVHTLVSGPAFHFSRIDDVDRLVSKIRVTKSLRIYGESGMGKSTVLPKLIAHSLRRTVIVILPDDDRALRAHSDYLDRPGKGLALPVFESACLADESFDFGSARLVWTGYRTFISWLFVRRFDDGYAELLKDKIVLVDQAESYGYASGMIDVAVAGLRPAKYLSVTSAGKLPAAEKPSLSVSPFPASYSPDGWDIAREGQPWSSATLEPVTVIYTNDQDTVQRLRKDYNNAGVATQSITKAASAKDLLASVEMISFTAARGRDIDARLVVFVDDSYRIGYHFGANTTIDVSSYEPVDPRDFPELFVDANKHDESVFLLDRFAPHECVTTVHGVPETTLPPEAYYESVSHLLYVLATADGDVTMPHEYWVCANRRSMKPNVAYIDLKECTTISRTGDVKGASTLTGIYQRFVEQGLNYDASRSSIGLTGYEVHICISRFNLLGVELSAMRRAVIDNFYCSRNFRLRGVARLKFLPALVRVSNLMSLERHILLNCLNRDLKTRSDLRRTPTANGRVDVKTRRYKWLLLGRYTAASQDLDCGAPRFRVRRTPAPDDDDDDNSSSSEFDSDSAPSWASKTSFDDEARYTSSWASDDHKSE